MQEILKQELNKELNKIESFGGHRSPYLPLFVNWRAPPTSVIINGSAASIALIAATLKPDRIDESTYALASVK